MRPHLIAIDGIDGAGKTYFADRLRSECAARSVPAEIVRVDDFRCRVDWGAGDQDEARLYYDEYYDFAQVDACLRAFAAGEPSFDMPVFDSVMDQVIGSRALRFDGTQVLILEGVFTLRIPAIAEGTLVYLATSYEEARRRIIERDLRKDRSLQEVLRRLDRRYFPSQRRYHAEHAPLSRAHVLIDNEDVSLPRTTRADVGGLPTPLRRALEALATRGCATAAGPPRVTRQ